MVDRREWLRSLVAGGVALCASPLAAAAGKRGEQVYVRKQPGCGCCEGWADHLRGLGFTVRVEESPDLAAVKESLGVPEKLRTCHTALVGGYVVEGHVPGDLVKRLLKEKPRVAGLAVPGMPVGSPGMEGPDPQRYDVIAFSRDGKTYTYARR